MRLLMVEDDALFANHVRRRLADDGIMVDHAPTLHDGLARACSGDYAGILLDIELPDGSGLTVLRELRAANHAVPVMIVSGVTNEETVIRVLEAGADDYVLKPVTLRMLRARIRALLRRGGSAHGDSARAGSLVVDHRQRAAWANGRMLDLTVLEFNLLSHLVTHCDEVQSRADLLERVWGKQSDAASNVVDVTVGRIRKELGAGEGLPEIESIRGIGYVLRTPEQLAARAKLP